MINIIKSSFSKINKLLLESVRILVRLLKIFLKFNWGNQRWASAFWLPKTRFSKLINYKKSRPKLIYSKKVLLRKRKRHTARRVASARYAVRSNGGGVHRVLPHHSDLGYPHHPNPGYPAPSKPRVPPHHPDLARGVPGVNPTIQTWGYHHTPSRPGQGVPRVSPNHPDLGYPPHHPDPGLPSPSRPRVPPTIQTWGTPPPPSRTEIPPTIQDLVYPHPDPGYLHHPDPGYPSTIQTQGTPHPDLGYPPPSRPRMGYPPKKNVNRHLWKQYLPLYFVRGW